MTDLERIERLLKVLGNAMPGEWTKSQEQAIHNETPTLLALATEALQSRERLAMAEEFTKSNGDWPCVGYYPQRTRHNNPGWHLYLSGNRVSVHQSYVAALDAAIEEGKK